MRILITVEGGSIEEIAYAGKEEDGLEVKVVDFDNICSTNDVIEDGNFDVINAQYSCAFDKLIEHYKRMHKHEEARYRAKQVEWRQDIEDLEKWLKGK